MMDLHSIAQQLVANNKGILAADESTGTIEKRLSVLGVESTEENRRAYRELLFTAPDIENYISGVIMFDETIRQFAKDGRSFVEVLQHAGVLPGIKVDLGTEPMHSGTTELVTLGLEGLPARLKEYKEMGAQFAKWRALIIIGDGLPTDMCIDENAKRLAMYAKMCQDAGIVPIVEPEVFMEGTHGIDRCEEVTGHVLETVFVALRDANVDLQGMILKPSMVIPGDKSGENATTEEIAERTLRCFRAYVPAEVPGIVFLSGGQTEEEATEHLNTISKIKGDAPWKLSFSYGRALQQSALETWGGKLENVEAAQAAFIKRAKLNSFACAGEYSHELE